MTATSSILRNEDFNNGGGGNRGSERVAQLLEIMWIMHWAYGYICRLFC